MSFFQEDSSPSIVKIKEESENKSQIEEHHQKFIEENLERSRQSFLASTPPKELDALQEGQKSHAKPSLFVDQETDEEEDEDYTLFESQIKAIIPDICPTDVQRLYLKHKDAENAVLNSVNEFYDIKDDVPMRSMLGYSSSPSRGVTSSPSRGQHTTVRQARSQRDIAEVFGSQSSQSRKKQKREIKLKEISPSIEWRRFIGSLQVVGWATRPTVKPIPYGTQLTIHKQALTPTNTRRGRNGNNNAVSSYIKLFQDYEDPSKRKEVGRLPEDIASILFPLVNQDICDFDITAVFCDGRLSTGDSFIVQLDCFLTSKIFDKYKGDTANENDLKQMKTKNNNFSSYSNGYETEEEQQIRKRQIGLLKLFNKLDFQVKISEEKEDVEEVIDLEDEEQMSNLESSSQVGKDYENSNEMNLNQLQEFYKRTQTEKVLETLPETETKENFKLDLRSYQKQGLTWMMRSERELENNEDGNTLNPLWKEFKWPKDRSWAVMRKEDLREKHVKTVFYGNLYSGEFSLERPILKSLCRGGILADEMGLGKTVSTLSLIHNVPSDKDYDLERAKIEEYAYQTTLVVVPTSLLQQWQDEFLKANNDNSTIYVYYGSDTTADLKDIIFSEKPPMVLFTTYGTVQNEWTRFMATAGDSAPKKGLYSLKFFRVVLDEGHNIRNRMNKTTKACYDLRVSRKWLLTGTPIINRLDDLYSLIKFLELEPWSHISYWNTFVTTPFEQKKYKQALDVVQSILDPILLRRTKNMKKNGKALVELPSKEVNIERIKFSPKEQNLYNWFLAQAESSVKAGIKRGDILKSYTTILVHILRLRQLCCHMDLIKSGSDELDEDISNLSKRVSTADIPEELLNPPHVTFLPNELEESRKKVHKQFLSIDNLECSICTTQPIEFEHISFTECSHSFCLSCILEHCTYQEMKGNKTLCPNCRYEISSAKLLQPKLTPTKDSDYALYKYDNSLRSSKLNALLSHLRIIRDSSANEKVVVFSQFSSYLDIMEREIQLENGLNVLKFHGRLSMEKRSEILKTFKDQKKGVTVLLLSLKAGGVGLNLTEASKAFMCDPWWSPSVEDQAIDRIHRIGQENNVKVVRFIMEGSIEEKMLKIQERKRTIGEAVEAEEEERRRRRVEEIQMLFENT
ncbi:hypothetical protein WICMUC_002716 [Wickerhamomyces mucosus]|uniref:DNA repair protein RAD5 n=1 Tax=Wickerhamomyces mucosus TaxID=1378264 RepID=A0A9P8PP07_9ASCO|nr:hypothetical protein WICMUC_002716 [Wickerhamomyces mucosus]